MLKILIVEGNVKESRAKASEAGLLTQSELYKKTLESLSGDLSCAIVYPTDDDAVLPDARQLAEFDGIVWTGSALNIYDRSPAVERQIEFMKRCLARESRIFGSCWGLEVAVVAAGGKVEKNKKGREIGIARNISVTDEGRIHPLYQGKPPVFDAVAIHLDHAVQLPPGTTVLSGNNISEIQAVEIRHGNAVFWGVQYHPEFDLEYIAALIRRYGEMLVEEGFCQDLNAVEDWAGDLSRAQSDKANEELIEKYRLHGDVLDPKCRLQELSNWLSYLRRGDAATSRDA